MNPVWLLALIAVLPLTFGRILGLEPRLLEAENSKQRRIRNGGGVKRKLVPSLNMRAAPPENVELSASESKVLECEAGGNPPPTIHWLKNGQRIPQSIYEMIHHTSNVNSDSPLPALGLSFTRSRLYLDCASPSDEGLYACVAENAFNRVSRVSKVKVFDWADGEKAAICLAKKSFGSPARIHMWTRTRLELMGSDVQLFCRFDGEPQPEVMWTGPDDIPIVGGTTRYDVLENGDLIIHNLNWDDMGSYTCNVKNSQGADSTSTFLYPTMPEKSKGENV